MIQLICEALVMLFAVLGFVAEGNPIFNIVFFLIAAGFAFVVVIIEDNKERRRFRK